MLYKLKVVLGVGASILFCLLGCMPTLAIVIRHDRDPADYLKGIEQYSMVCEVGGGMGTLIAPDWILTAGHVADSLPSEAAKVTCGGTTHKAKRIVIHHHYADGDRHRDVALIQLAKPFEDITPAKLNFDQNETDLPVKFVGSGYTGTGKTGPKKGERIFRVAQNRVDGVSPIWVFFDFDAPPEGEPLEGISGPGDSGGPALIKKDDGWYVIGVSAANDGEPPCRYGSKEFYTRVATLEDWILSIMAGAEVKPAPRAMRYGKTESGQDTVERQIAIAVHADASDTETFNHVTDQLMQAMVHNQQEAFLALFSPRLIRERAKANDPLENTLDFLVQNLNQRGGMAHRHPPTEQLAKITDSEFPVRTLVFHFADGMPAYFGIALTPEGLIDHFSYFVMEKACKKGRDCKA